MDIQILVSDLMYETLDENSQGGVRVVDAVGWVRCVGVHWNGNVFILMKFSSLAALEVVKMTTSSAASD